MKKIDTTQWKEFNIVSLFDVVLSKGDIQARKMQEDMETLQAELDEKEYTIKAGGGVATIVIKGTKEIQSIELSPEIVDPDDIETLEDLIVAAVNEAVKKVEAVSSEEMQKITGSMGIPGIPGIF